MLAQGIFTKDELARFRNRPVEEIGRPQPKPPTLQSVSTELREIDRLRRQDRRAWFKDGAKQAREIELLEMREKLRAQPPAESEAVDYGDAPGLDPALLEEWENAAGVEYHLQTAQRSAQAALDGLEDEDRAALQTGFDGLPRGAQTAVFRFLALEPGGSSRSASNEALQEFASTEEGAELAKEWGREAGRLVGVVRSRMNLMLQSMTPEDRSAATEWFDRLSPSQAGAVLRALAAQ